MSKRNRHAPEFKVALEALKGEETAADLGSRLIEFHSQKMTVAARRMAERKSPDIGRIGLQRAASPGDGRT